MSAYQIEMETLTPVHIGDGVFLQKGSDFVTVKRKGSNDETYYMNFIIDPQKVLACVGVEHLSDWMVSIERHEESALAFARRYDKNIRPEDLAKRSIYCYASDVRPTDTLKTCLHNGMGLPYIPGSSIKGSIRTAVLATLVSGQPNLEDVVRTGDGFSAKQVESKYFGSEPNQDVFRFLQVGDAYFSKGCEGSVRMENLNVREKRESLWDSSKSQLVEVIDPHSKTTFQLALADGGKLPECMNSLSALFDMLNGHTIKLVNEEIDYWEELMSGDYTDAEDYVDNLKCIRAEVLKCRKGEECVVRIGYGSGWRFITGAWCERLDNFEEIVNKTRPNNRRYEQYDFPKSRKLDEESDVLGFVKLSYKK